MQFGDWIPKWLKSFVRNTRAEVTDRIMVLFMASIMGAYTIPKAIIMWANASAELTAAGVDAGLITLVTEVVPMIIAVVVCLLFLAVRKSN